MGERAFFFEDMALDRGPAGAAELDRPVAGQPAALAQGRVPFLVLGLGQFLVQTALCGQPFGQAVPQELADLGAERLIPEGEAHVHDGPFQKISISPAAP